ncbi:MAG: hypothetical protein IPJ65_24710 [Archangiaceae bacterium]|nr:hypothetical protein [Archangiaceae bacterium]
MPGPEGAGGGGGGSAGSGAFGATAGAGGLSSGGSSSPVMNEVAIFSTGGRSSASASSAMADFSGHDEAPPGPAWSPHERLGATCCSTSGVGAEGRGGLTARSKSSLSLATESGGSLSRAPFLPNESTSLKSTVASRSVVPASTAMR